jgi:hypothetical protein
MWDAVFLFFFAYYRMVNASVVFPCKPKKWTCLAPLKYVYVISSQHTPAVWVG